METALTSTPEPSLPSVAKTPIASQLIRLPISTVIVTDDRQRKGIGTVDGKNAEEGKKVKIKFDELKTSLRDNGQLQPIGVDKENKLIFGFRRLKAATELGWTNIDAIVIDRELSELQREVIELDENIQRLGLSWSEEQSAIARINRIKQQLDPQWTQRKTAQSLGIHQSQVSVAEKMEAMLKLFPDLAKAKSLRAAVSQATQKAKVHLRKHEVKSNPAKYEEVSKKVVQGFAEKVILDLPDGFTHHIITDGPFGINYDQRPAGDGKHEAYEDTPEMYRSRTEAMAPHMFRVLRPDSFLVWFLAHDHLDWTRELFRSAGFTVDPLPIIWDRSDGRCYTARPDRYLGRGYDIAIHAFKGNPALVVKSRNKGKHGSGNVFRYKPVDVADKEHIVERPIELYQDIILTYSIQGEKVTDFFAGSGKISAAAASLGRDHFAVEMNPNHIPLIVQNIYNNTPQPEGK